MRRVIVGIGLLAIAAACGDDDGVGVEQEFFQALLFGDEEVPPVETDALGDAAFLTDGTTMEYEIVVAHIVDAIAAHIHEGEVGENGPILVTLFSADPPGVTVEETAQLVRDSFTDEDVDMTMNELLDLMRSGGAYVNVHTVDNPGGEIRGQIAQPE